MLTGLYTAAFEVYWTHAAWYYFGMKPIIFLQSMLLAALALLAYSFWLVQNEQGELNSRIVDRLKVQEHLVDLLTMKTDPSFEFLYSREKRATKPL